MWAATAATARAPGTAYDPALTDRAAAAWIRVYTVGLGSSVDDALLGEIAGRNGATYYKVDQANGLSGIFENI